MPCPAFSLFGFQFAFVGLDETPDILTHVEQFLPLLFIQRHRKATEPVDGNTAFFADSEAGSLRCAFLEALIFGTQTGKFVFQIFGFITGHGISFADDKPNRKPVGNSGQVRRDLVNGIVPEKNRSGITPGDYRLYSWESLENFGYFDPQVLREAEPFGKLLHVAESSKQQLDVRMIPASR